jgi:hypothetical protein
LDAEEDDGETLSGNATFTIYQTSGNGTYAPVDVLISEIDDDITLTVNSDGNGSVTGGGIVDPAHAPFAITATPDVNFAFDSWSGNIGVITNVLGNSTTINTSVSETITANFISTVPLVVVENDPVSVAEGSANIIRVKLTPAPTSDLTLGFHALSGGDSDLTISSNTVVITSGNTNWHEVMVDAAEDGDSTSGNTLFSIYKVSGVDTINGNTVDVQEDDYDISPCSPFSNYMDGNDKVYTITLDKEGYLTGNILGAYGSIHVLGKCPKEELLKSDCKAFVGGPNGGEFTHKRIAAGTYYVVISTWAPPQTVDYLLNMSFSETSTGIDEGSLANNLSVYPNPTNGKFTVSVSQAEASDLTIDLVNISGQVVYSNQVSAVYSYNEDIDASSFAKGVYYLKVNNGEEVKVEKIVIQ